VVEAVVEGTMVVAEGEAETFGVVDVGVGGFPQVGEEVVGEAETFGAVGVGVEVVGEVETVGVVDVGGGGGEEGGEGAGGAAGRRLQ